MTKVNKIQTWSLNCIDGGTTERLSASKHRGPFYGQELELGLRVFCITTLCHDEIKRELTVLKSVEFPETQNTADGADKKTTTEPSHKSLEVLQYVQRMP